jgi:hypothetical protein
MGVDFNNSLVNDCDHVSYGIRRTTAPFNFANLICITIRVLMNTANRLDGSELMGIPSKPVPATFIPVAYLAFSQQKLEFPPFVALLHNNAKRK